MISNRKVVLVGTGFVGMSMAYSILNQGSASGVNELVLIDIVEEKVLGEVMDLSHGLPSSPSHMKIKAGKYSDCKDADIVVITAGLNQKPGQTRLELSTANAKIIKQITEQVVESGFNGIFLIASNPVDLMTKVVQEVSGFSPSKVIGSGTALDTARLRYLIADKIKINPKNVAIVSTSMTFFVLPPLFNTPLPSIKLMIFIICIPALIDKAIFATATVVALVSEYIIGTPVHVNITSNIPNIIADIFPAFRIKLDFCTASSTSFFPKCWATSENPTTVNPNENIMNISSTLKTIW